MNNEQQPNVERLPLWKSTFDDMIQSGEIDYEKTIPIKTLEERFKCKFGDSQFAFALMNFRRLCKASGFFTSMRGTNQQYLCILPKKDSYRPVKKQLWQAVKLAIDNSIGLSTVSRDGLSPDENTKLDAWQYKSAKVAVSGKSILLQRKLPDSPDMKQISS